MRSARFIAARTNDDQVGVIKKEHRHGTERLDLFVLIRHVGKRRLNPSPSRRADDPPNAKSSGGSTARHDSDRYDFVVSLRDTRARWSFSSSVLLLEYRKIGPDSPFEKEQFTTSNRVAITHL